MRTHSSLFYAHLDMAAGAKAALPNEHRERAIHVAAGTVEVAGARSGIMACAEPNAAPMRNAPARLADGRAAAPWLSGGRACRGGGVALEAVARLFNNIGLYRWVIGEPRRVLHAVAKGLIAPSNYFNMLATFDPEFGSHRRQLALAHNRAWASASAVLP